MHESDIRHAAQLLATARREGRPLRELPAQVRPADFAEAAAIQLATASALGETVAGYKIAGTDPDTLQWGAVLASRLLASPARIAAATMPLLGVEAEIAFRLDIDVTDRDPTLTLDRFDRMVTVIPAIEVVDTRFTSYGETPPLQRTADFMSNGALVCGEPRVGGDDGPLSALAVRLLNGDAVMAEAVGGHSAGDPRLPALAFLKAASRPARLPRGTVLTTGTHTGLRFVTPGDRISALFAGFAAVTVTFTA